MQPSHRTRVSIRKQNQAPRFTDEEVSNFSVDQPAQDGKGDAVKRGPLSQVEQRSVEVSPVEGKELWQSITMPPVGECHFTWNPVELEDNECTDSVIDMFGCLGTPNTSARPVASIDHPPMQPTISLKKDKRVLTSDTSRRHGTFTSSDRRPPTTNKTKLSGTNYTGTMTRNKSYEAEQLAWALAESKKEYEKARQRSIYGSTSSVIPQEGTSSHAAEVDSEIAKPANGFSKDENDVLEALIILSKTQPKENSKYKKEGEDDDLGGSKDVKMRSMRSIFKDC